MSTETVLAELVAAITATGNQNPADWCCCFGPWGDGHSSGCARIRSALAATVAPPAAPQEEEGVWREIKDWPVARSAMSWTTKVRGESLFAGVSLGALPSFFWMTGTSSGYRDTLDAAKAAAVASVRGRR